VLTVEQVDAKKPAATSTGATTTMSIVDREIQRQRERETQQRAERELLATASLLTPSSPSPAVSPTTGGPLERRPARLLDAERLAKRRTFDGESSLVHEMDEQRQREDELRRQRAEVNGYGSPRAPAGHVTRTATNTVRPLVICTSAFRLSVIEVSVSLLCDAGTRFQNFLR